MTDSEKPTQPDEIPETSKPDRQHDHGLFGIPLIGSFNDIVLC